MEGEQQEELPPPESAKQQKRSSQRGGSGAGTILEGAFVDPAYNWPPADGQGKNAIELQASLELLGANGSAAGDNDSVFTTDTARQRMKDPKLPSTALSRRLFFCCGRNGDAAAVSPEQMDKYRAKKLQAEQARNLHAKAKKKYLQQKEMTARLARKYETVPEGILIYRLDTSTGVLELVSNTHDNTPETILRHCVVAHAVAAPHKSRRAIELTDQDGQVHILTACEQRTATAWLEAVNLLHAKNAHNGGGLFRGRAGGKSRWDRDDDLDHIEDQYMNLAFHSNNLIRSGALPAGKKGGGGSGGIYYSVEKTNVDQDDDYEEEALEAVAKRRAVMKDSWDFYRMICSLLRDRNKYDEVFRRLQLDPVYPYLNSMTGLADPGDTNAQQYENLDKTVIQRDLPEFSSMTKTQVAQALVKQAEAALPSLVDICKALAGSLGMEEVGVGPVKEASAAIRKAEKKYGGDLLKVTDYCRALLVVKDFPSLLALLELARDSFGPLITRVKMSPLKSDQKPKPGGYRDCIINVELKGHICEIQIHLWPMWVICGVDGFRHYRHCVEYNTDSFVDPFDALDGLDRKTVAELIVMAEEAVAETPLDNLEWYHEKFILDYFAEAGLFMKHGLDVWAEITFRHLIRLRTESTDIGPDHHETLQLYSYLAKCLRKQNKNAEAKDVEVHVERALRAKHNENEEAAKDMWASFGEVYDMVVDPSRKDREAEHRFRKAVKQSKKAWRRVRQERFPFLDMDIEEKKIDR